jgi:hypothetical protein
MAKRALIGLIKGLLIGGIFALVLVKGLGVAVFGALLAYPLAVLIGILTGLVAGKPIWAQDGRIEAALKAIVGAIVAGGLMFAIRTWLNPSVDLGSLGAGGIGELPLVSLPLIATALSVLYELDNTGPEPGEQAPGKQRIARGAAKDTAGALETELDADDEAHAAERARRKD